MMTVMGQGDRLKAVVEETPDGVRVVYWRRGVRRWTQVGGEMLLVPFHVGLNHAHDRVHRLTVVE